MNVYGSRWIRPEKRKRVYERDDFRCLWCTRDLRFVAQRERTLDHVLPRERGGTNDAHNLITSCLSCNSKRQHMVAIHFAYLIAERGLSGTQAPQRVVAQRAGIILARILDAVLTELPRQVSIDMSRAVKRPA